MKDGKTLIQTPILDGASAVRDEYSGQYGPDTFGSDEVTVAKSDTSNLSKDDALDLASLRKMKQDVDRREAQLNPKDPAAVKSKMPFSVSIRIWRLLQKHMIPPLRIRRMMFADVSQIDCFTNMERCVAVWLLRVLPMHRFNGRRWEV